MLRPYFLLLILCLTLSGCIQNGPENQLTPQYAKVTHGQIEYYRFGKGSPIVSTDVPLWLY